jgi:hypothetical protein
MATAKKNTKHTAPDDDQIIARYMEDVLTGDGRPNVYGFCKKNGFEETDFYTFFASLEDVREKIWVKFFENAIRLMQNEAGFGEYSSRNKLLAFHFTFFEILSLNRSYVLFTLEENREGLKNLRQLRQLRRRFLDFATELVPHDERAAKMKIDRVTKPVLSEGAWVQLLFILKFWLNDHSKGFEKTDILIEKSVNTALALIDTKPLENLFDLGKFLFNEVRTR